MSISTPTAAAPSQRPGRRPAVSRESLQRPLLIAAGLVVLSTAIVLWARTRPGFDPFGWMVWGRQTVSGSLNTNAAPSWKPLPYLFTLPYAVFGHYQLWLWMITVVAVSLGGVVFAARIAYRLTSAPPERRWAAWVAGAFAGAALLGVRDYPHYILSAQSDPMIVALCLGAIDAHLSGRRRLAFACGCLAALGRPEVWPFLALYVVWGWRGGWLSPRLVGGGVAAVALLWFGIPALTSRSPFVAANNAMGSGRRLRSDRVLGTIDRFLDMHETALELAALLSLALAVLRRDRATLVLAAGAVAWVLVEVAFALHGWPGLTRYMFEAGAVMIVLAGVAVGRLLADPPRVASLAGAAGLVVAAAVIVGLLPAAVSRSRGELRDLRAQRVRTALINSLPGTISRAGGASRLLACGEPLTLLEYQTTLAWYMHINVVKIGWKVAPAVASGRPIVIIWPHRHGWTVQALHGSCPL
ncbi:MAG TPA: hypothetical protein VKT31_05455 [Solirubrobacteraceae bacterium]|nr:hypothetical protein [Solirubrobacteraceae bacterium]